jgi:hypothetical protein
LGFYHGEATLTDRTRKFQDNSSNLKCELEMATETYFLVVYIKGPGTMDITQTGS